VRKSQCALLLTLLLPVAPASAADVTVLDGPGRTHVESERFSGQTELFRTSPTAARAPVATASARTVTSELRRLRDEGQIGEGEYQERTNTFAAALASRNRLSGRRRIELQAVINTLHDIAARGRMTATRLPALFLTLERNRQWWTTGSLLSSGTRVRFRGSRLIWQYYAGQGIQLQMLANWGRVNGLWDGGYDDAMRSLIEELLPLASDRGDGVLAWEYYFRFDGGSPPWTSAMSQGTAIQALSRAATRLADPTYADVAREALDLFDRAPPIGVRVGTEAGAHYLIYSFHPHLRVLNAFAQTLIGLRDMATLTGDERAGKLFEAGDAEARHELPAYDTGAWSLYDGRRESDLGYHRILRDFLSNLCSRTGTAEYCDAAQRFTRYMKERPRIEIVTERARAGHRGRLYFELSKISTVTVTVRSAAGVVYSATDRISRGRHWFGWHAPKRKGAYRLVITATDLAGNRRQVSRALPVR
jgi:hypothetical protein